MKINKIILLMVIICSFECVAAQNYVLNLSYNNGNISLSSLSVTLAKEEVNYGDYAAAINSFEGKTLNKIYFSVPDSIIFDVIDNQTGTIDGGGIFSLNQTNFTIYLPYYDNAKEIRIYDPNMVLKLIVPVSQFSKDLCGDSTCQFYESVNSCPTDCAASKVNVIAVGKEKSIIEKVTQYAEQNQTMVIGLIVLVALILIIVLMTRKKSESK